MNTEKRTRGQKMKADAVDKEIGFRIGIIRHRNGLDQRFMSDLLGVSHQQYMKYEHGKNKIPAHFIIKLAEFFKTDCNYFLSNSFAIPTVSATIKEDLTPKVLEVEKQKEESTETLRITVKSSVAYSVDGTKLLELTKYPPDGDYIIKKS